MAEPHPVGEEADAMITEEDIPDNGGDVARRRPTVICEPFDVEEYVELYTGRTKIKRLCFIADNCESTSMQLEALEMAYVASKKGEDTWLFMDVVGKIAGRLDGTRYGPDDAWADEVDRQAELRKERLKKKLIDVKIEPAILIKESVRMAYNDLGDFYYAHGHLDEARKNYVNKIYYCTTPNHVVEMCLSVILVCIEMGDFSRVATYARKGLTQERLDAITIAKLNCAVGLANLKDREYTVAVWKFLLITPVIGNHYSEVIAPRDIATYGGLCALASFDRADLKSKVIDNIFFRVFLEYVPDVRELINNFYESNFAICLEYLKVLKPTLLLDIHLHDHVEELYAQIHKKALIQYTLPYSIIDLHTMSDVFKTSVMELEKEFVELIVGEQIQARIDSQKKVLHVKRGNQRNRTFRRVLQMGEDLARMMRRMLLMKNFME